MELTPSRSIPDDMKLPYALEKTREYITRDLESMFRRVVAANDGRVPAMPAGMRQRCDELKRCRNLVEPGTVRRQLKHGGYTRS